MRAWLVLSKPGLSWHLHRVGVALPAVEAQRSVRRSVFRCGLVREAESRPGSMSSSRSSFNFDFLREKRRKRRRKIFLIRFQFVFLSLTSLSLLAFPCFLKMAVRQ